MPRTAFIVGAGFSYPGGIPVQAGLLERVRDLGIMDAPQAVVEQYLQAQATALDFIAAISRSDVVPPLEDAFTLLDQTIASRGFSLGYTWREATVIRERLQRALLVVLHSSCSDVQQREFYRDAATYFLARATGSHSERASVLSLNWDSVLEDAVFSVVRSSGAEGSLDIDFGCDTEALAVPSAHSPSLTQAARGVGNLELLKLHGSINWLHCPNCQALYSGAGVREWSWDLYFGESPCPRCSPVRPEGDSRSAAHLEPLMITPTFLKVLDSIHIQSTWQRAYHALARVQEVVFLGYSLPLADFHLRTLLRRALSRDIHVTAVLMPADDCAAGTPSSIRAHFAASRYRDFFGEAVTIDTRGVEPFLRDAFASTPQGPPSESLRSRAAGPSE